MKKNTQMIILHLDHNYGHSPDVMNMWERDASVQMKCVAANACGQQSAKGIKAK